MFVSGTSIKSEKIGGCVLCKNLVEIFKIFYPNFRAFKYVNSFLSVKEELPVSIAPYLIPTFLHKLIPMIVKFHSN